ncbi:MAG TPA: hypothetical protein VJ643_06900 [Nitrososphaera sp.]|nr:hypothetical protein [Nitrososphaera sp.]
MVTVQGKYMLNKIMMDKGNHSWSNGKWHAGSYFEAMTAKFVRTILI